MLRAAGVEAIENTPVPLRRRVRGARHQEVDSFAVGAVGGERLSPSIELSPPWVPETSSKYTQLQRLRPELPNPARIQSAYAVRRLDVRVNIDRLIHVEHSVRRPS